MQGGCKKCRGGVQKMHPCRFCRGQRHLASSSAAPLHSPICSNRSHPPCKKCRGGAKNAGGGCRKCTPADFAGVNAIWPAQGPHPCKVCTPCRKCTPAKSAGPPCRFCTRNRK